MINYNIISTGSQGNAVVIERKILVDCGVSFKALAAECRTLKLVLLTQENPFPTSGAVHFQLQVPTLEDIYPRAQAAGAVTQEPFFRPYGWHMFRMADPAGNHINIYTVPTTAE